METNGCTRWADYSFGSTAIKLTGRIDIVAKKHDGGRGQAFIVFEEQAAATAALRGLNDTQFYNRDMVSGFGAASGPPIVMSSLSWTWPGN